MPNMLPLPRSESDVVEAPTTPRAGRPTKAFYDWLVRLQSVIADKMTSTTNLTVTAQVGTITTATAQLWYKQIGKLVFFELQVTITTNGTGATFVIVQTAPFLPVRTATFYGRAANVSGKGLQGNFNTAGQFQIFNYDNTYPGADGELFIIAGHCEIA